MSKEMIALIRKGREIRIPLDDGRFVLARRPTDIEMVAAQGKPFHELGASHVTGWEGWTENDVTGNANGNAAAFTPELWAEVYADRPDLWEKVSHAILESYGVHAKQIAERAKN